MKGDFSRVTFDQTKHFSQVLMQQGRVQLDADWNEQVAILLHYMRTLATDLIGPHGGPVGEYGGFAIEKTQAGFLIKKGRYYVNGLLCENEEDFPWTPESSTTPPYLLYLDVWERLVTYIEDDAIREVALDGPDTAVRSQLVWQVKTIGVPSDAACDNLDWDNLVKQWQPENRGLLKAQAKMPEAVDDFEPCTITPDARYRGAENQLYRVEIHKPGPAGSATFKWSRENGSVTFPITAMSGEFVTVENIGRFSLKKDDWVEIVDDEYILEGRAEPLYQVDNVDPMTGQIKLNTAPDAKTEHPLLRRWDHKAGNAEKGGLELAEGSAIIREGKLLKLEDGIAIQFQPNSGNYRTGDYWLIPARTITGDVEWPRDEDGKPKAIPPHGVEHHYAPLAIVTDATTDLKDCRRSFEPMQTATQNDADNAADGNVAATGRDVQKTASSSLPAEVPANVLQALVSANEPSGDNAFVTKKDLPKPQLTPRQVNAIKNATGVSGKNPFMTQADVETKLATKADVEPKADDSG